MQILEGANLDTWLTRRAYWIVTKQWRERSFFCKQAKTIVAAGLFDPAFYLWQYPDVKRKAMGAKQHYIDFGAFEDRQPNAVFDRVWYAQQAGQDFANRTQALSHYVRLGGGLSPHPLFDAGFYRRALSGSQQSANLLAHYLTAGHKQGLKPHPLFDPVHVRRQASDLVRSSLEPLTFFLSTKSVWRPDPHPLFDSAFYCRRNPEVVRNRLNCVVHYVVEGSKQARDPHPLFDTRHFIQACPEAAGTNALEYYLTEPSARLCPTHELFDPAYYLDQVGSAIKSDVTPLEHYLRAAPANQYPPSASFNPQRFRRRHEQVGEQRRDPLAYYAEFRDLLREQRDATSIA